MSHTRISLPFNEAFKDHILFYVRWLLLFLIQCNIGTWESLSICVVQSLLQCRNLRDNWTHIMQETTSISNKLTSSKSFSFSAFHLSVNRSFSVIRSWFNWLHVSIIRSFSDISITLAVVLRFTRVALRLMLKYNGRNSFNPVWRRHCGQVKVPKVEVAELRNRISKECWKFYQIEYQLHLLAEPFCYTVFMEYMTARCRYRFVWKYVFIANWTLGAHFNANQFS